jgi:tetratricopeptide (TPR) repeat protein
VGRRLALLVATYAYEDEELRQLTAPGPDADALAEVLRDPDIAGFEVEVLVNEPHHRVGAALGTFFGGLHHDDLALVYFTGHGLKDKRGGLHLATTDTRRANLMFTSLAADQVAAAMTASMSRQQVLVLDCCYSGAFPAERLAKGDADVHALTHFQGRGRTVLTATDSARYAFEGDRLHGSAPRSVFTGHLVQGLRDGSADLDGDGDITLDELYTYVHDKVVAEMPEQRPQKQDNVEGRIVIARNVNWDLPADLLHKLGSPFVEDRIGGARHLAHLYRGGNGRVRARAAERLRVLADDDSRRVRAEALGALGDAEPTPAAHPFLADIGHLLDQATAERDAGALEEAEDHYWSALDLAIQHHARQKEGWAWDGLGSCRSRQGDHGTAMRFFVRADRLADETGDTLLKAWSLHNFGTCRRKHDDVPAARDFFAQAIAVAEAHEHHAAGGWTHHAMAELARADSDYGREREHYAAAARAGLASRDDVLGGWSLFHVARCAEESGDLPGAREHFEQTKDIGARSNPEMLRLAEESLARLATQLDSAPSHRGAADS